MAITFTNVIYDKVIDNIHDIIANEFGIQIFYDEHKGNQSFLLQPVSDDLNEQITTGIVRDYTILISYQVDFAGNYTKESFRQVSLIAEIIETIVYQELGSFITLSSTLLYMNVMKIIQIYCVLK